MASQAQCDAALRALAARLAAVDPDIRAKYLLERTVSCRVTDLDLTWSAQLTEQGLVNVTTSDQLKAQIRLSIASDDLLAVLDGRLAVPTAVAMGKLRVQASPLDLLRLGAYL